jgi:hypothetical protein
MTPFSIRTRTVISASALLLLSSAAVVEACGTAQGDSATDGGSPSLDGTTSGEGGLRSDAGAASDGTTSDGAVSDGGVSDGGPSDGAVSDGGVSDGGASDGAASLPDGGDASSGEGGSPPGTDSGWYPAYNPDASAACTGTAETLEFTSCTQASDCACGALACVNDPTFNQGGFALGTVCEYACKQDSDCISFDSHCLNGSCSPVFCGGTTGNGTYGGTCTVRSPGDGTCVPTMWPSSKPKPPTFPPTIEVGFCTQGGTSVTDCASAATASGVDLSIGIDRTNVSPSDLCAPGTQCTSTWARDAGWSHCVPSCYPPTPGDPACPSGDSCVGIPGHCVDASTPAGPVCAPIRGTCCPAGGCTHP